MVNEGIALGIAKGEQLGIAKGEQLGIAKGALLEISCQARRQWKPTAADKYQRRYKTANRIKNVPT